jgi:hypothetical protein
VARKRGKETTTPPSDGADSPPPTAGQVVLDPELTRMVDGAAGLAGMSRQNYVNSRMRMVVDRELPLLVRKSGVTGKMGAHLCLFPEEEPATENDAPGKD